MGDYDTDEAKNLMVIFEKCDIKTDSGTKPDSDIICKSDAEINEWL